MNERNMCLHIAVAKRAQEIASEYRRKISEKVTQQKIAVGVYHISAFTRPLCCTITAGREVRIGEWGLIPHWVKDRKSADAIGRLTYNARAESIFEKPAFREAVRMRRCIIPVTGFFEWRHEGGEAIPYYIFPGDAPVFSLGAMWDDWTDPVTGCRISAFSIITTPANPKMEYIHNTKKRMPLILSRQDEEQWLDPESSVQKIAGFMKPCDTCRMEAYEIERDFLRKPPEDKTIINPFCRLPGLF